MSQAINEHIYFTRNVTDMFVPLAVVVSCMFVVWFIFEHYIPKCKLLYRFCITVNVYKFCLFFIEFYFPNFCPFTDVYEITRKYLGSSVWICEA